PRRRQKRGAGSRQARPPGEEGKARRTDRYPEISKGGDAASGISTAAESASRGAGENASGAGQVRRALVFTAIGAVASVVTASPVSAATPSDCWTLTRHGKRAEAVACYQSLAATADHYLRAEGLWGLEQYQDANNEF